MKKKKTRRQPQTWQEICQQSLDQYLKKTKAAATGSLCVLGTYGDRIVEYGKKVGIDSTTLGSLAASVAAAGESLGKFLKLSGEPIQFGTGGKKVSKGFWFARLNGDYLLVGIRCPLNAQELQKVMKSLKKNLAPAKKASTPASAHEAFDGLTTSGVEAEVENKMRSQ